MTKRKTGDRVKAEVMESSGAIHYEYGIVVDPNEGERGIEWTSGRRPSYIVGKLEVISTLPKKGSAPYKLQKLLKKYAGLKKGAKIKYRLYGKVGQGTIEHIFLDVNGSLMIEVIPKRTKQFVKDNPIMGINFTMSIKADNVIR